ncbi:hypothetical protein ACLB2K_003192 [Fragaria x ananassa]
MVPSSNANPNNKRLKKQDHEQVDQNAMAADTLLPHLPDLILEKIFRLIPTKLAIRSSIVSKQWASVWSLGVPFLYFDDEGESDDRRKVTYCECMYFNVEAENLESFVFVSVFPQLSSIYLSDECVKLKNIGVCAHHSDKTSFRMPGKCPHNLKAIIDIPNLLHLTYNGYLLTNDVISVNARKRFDASLMLNWDDDDQGLEPPRTHFPTWRNLLQNFSCCNEVELDIRHDAVARALTFPENFRKTFSPPLLHIQRLKVFIVRLRCPQTMAGISAFTDSLRWMAPNALISLAYWDYGEFDSDYGEFDSSGEDE